MIDLRFLGILRKICTVLENCRINWVITGSLGMILQGMDLEIHDIDIQTDQRGAYAIESCFSETHSVRNEG